MRTINVSRSVIQGTIAELQSAGEHGSERVVLWLGTCDSDRLTASDLFVPEQFARRDMFRIPRSGVSAMLRHLRQTGQRIISQVHSHPEEAFHSCADDRWAIVRHVGAFSIVIPDFASRTVVGSFFDVAAVFRLSPENEWLEIGKREIRNIFRIEP